MMAVQDQPESDLEIRRTTPKPLPSHTHSPLRKWIMMLPKIETAVRKLLKAAPDSPAKEVHGRLALHLAAALDAGETGSTTANVARELRATVAQLLPGQDTSDHELEDILRDVRR
jgi:hypothetical protein